MKYRFLIIGLMGAIFFSCMNEEVEVPGGSPSGNDKLNLFITTPDELLTESEVRASYNGPNADESSVKSLWLLVFEGPSDTDKLLEKKSVTYTTVEGVKINGQVELESDSDASTTIRFLANMGMEGVVEGQTWGDVRRLTYAVDNGAAQAFPMTAELQSNFRTQTSIGTPENRVRLIRSMAKITFNISSEGDFEYLGNRVFNLKGKGFAFPTTQNNAPDDAGIYNENDYNKRSVTYTPERLNTIESDGNRTPLDDRSFFVVRGKYKGHEGYYRIDFYNDATKEFLDFKRNTNYNFRVTVNGFGYDSEAEAIEHPMNGGYIVHVIADINDAYNFITNGAGNFLGFSNAAVTIFGKPAYYTKGFSGSKTRYEYVLTSITNEKAAGWDPSDIVIIDGGRIENPRIVVVDKYDELGNPVVARKEYLLVGRLPDNFKVGEETSVTIKYKTLSKEITVRREQYIDCHFTNISYSRESTSFSEVRLTQSRKSDGGYVENNKFPMNAPTHLSWIMLYNPSNVSEQSNARFTDYQSRTSLDQWVSGNNGPVKIRFHEHLDGSKMGRFAASNADFEGFRFADVYATARNTGERHKLVLAQANADLAGFFGHESIRPNYRDLQNRGRAVSGNYGPDNDVYDRYLVVERITDTYRRESLAASIEEYCRSHSPSDMANLWYAPTYSQLLGIWVADNSNSRRTSPFQTEEMGTGGNFVSNTYPYFGRSIFKSFHETAYKRINETLPDIYGVENVPFVSFLYGETQRGAQADRYIAVRCVRNMETGMEPSGLPTTSRNPVSSDRIVTMDPRGFLSEDYFSNDSWNYPAIRNNKVARSFQVDRDYVSTQDVYRFTRYGTDSYRTSTERNVEGEATHSASLTGASSRGKRLPTMRELNLMFIYKYYLEATPSFKKFNMDEPDGSGVTENYPEVKYPHIMRYPATTGAWRAPTYFYWSSSLRDPTRIYPMRISMDMGMVNTRGDGAGQDNQVDHRRFVKTVQEK